MIKEQTQKLVMANANAYADIMVCLACCGTYSWNCDDNCAGCVDCGCPCGVRGSEVFECTRRFDPDSRHLHAKIYFESVHLRCVAINYVSSISSASVLDRMECDVASILSQSSPKLSEESIEHIIDFVRPQNSVIKVCSVMVIAQRKFDHAVIGQWCFNVSCEFTRSDCETINNPTVVYTNSKYTFDESPFCAGHLFIHPILRVLWPHATIKHETEFVM